MAKLTAAQRQKIDGLLSRITGAALKGDEVLPYAKEIEQWWLSVDDYSGFGEPEQTIIREVLKVAGPREEIALSPGDYALLLQPMRIAEYLIPISVLEWIQKKTGVEVRTGRLVASLVSPPTP